MESSRREFLTGEAVLRAGRAAGGKLADALNSAAGRVPPAGKETIRLETTAMACSWAVILDPGPHEQVMAASDALGVVHQIERELTVYRSDSLVSKLNRDAAQAPCAVTPELFALLLECRRLYDETEHAFDPASQALIALWGTCRHENRVPSQEEIDAALRHSGMSRVRLLDAEATGDGNGAGAGAGTPRVAYEAPGVGLNFGGIGKGYAIDRAAERLRGCEIPDFLVHGGHSSLYAAGEHYLQGGWPVGLKNPLFTEEAYLTLVLHDEGLSSSGSNVQYFRHGGRRYGHILDPRSGWPAEGLLSVTVSAPTATEADALSTAFYVLGLEKSAAYCDNHPSVGAILTPHPKRGRTLSPLVRNIPPERLFVTSPDVEPTGV